MKIRFLVICQFQRVPVDIAIWPEISPEHSHKEAILNINTEFSKLFQSDTSGDGIPIRPYLMAIIEGAEIPVIVEFTV